MLGVLVGVWSRWMPDDRLELPDGGDWAVRRRLLSCIVMGVGSVEDKDALLPSNEYNKFAYFGISHTCIHCDTQVNLYIQSQTYHKTPALSIHQSHDMWRMDNLPS